MADIASLCNHRSMIATRPCNPTQLIVGALAVVTVAGGFAGSALACRVPFRFDPAQEHHEVVVVAVALRRDDWGRYTYNTGIPIDRDTGEPARYGYPRQWAADLRTLRVLKGEAIPIIQVAPDEAYFAAPEGDVAVVSSCGDGIETPQPGQTYVVYLDRRDGILRTTRLVDIALAQRSDPLFYVPDQ